MGSSNDHGSNRFEVAIVLADLPQLPRQDSAIFGSAIHPPISASPNVRPEDYKCEK